MARKKLDTSKLNIRRLELINKGHLNRAEIKEFVPCGKNKAGEIYKEIRKEVEAEGLENCYDVILVGRLLKYCDLTVEGVKAAAKIESKGL